ncbi:MAG: ECF transporter S component [Clostridiales bacterium]|nr:ECF transporter S component [Clostridiales bacterium]
MSEVTTNLKSRNESRKALIRKIAVAGVMTALAEVLMMLEIPLPLMPGFLKYDFSDIPALFTGFACGPIAGVVVELLKNLIHFVLGMSTTEGIGEVANFISGSIFILTATIIYLRMKNKKGVVLSLVFGTVALTIATSFVNYFFCIPLYEKVCGFPLPVIIDLCDKANTLVKIDSKLDVILMTFVPFNIFKGITISMVAFLCYIPLRRYFEDKTEDADVVKDEAEEN